MRVPFLLPTVISTDFFWSRYLVQICRGGSPTQENKGTGEAGMLRKWNKIRRIICLPHFPASINKVPLPFIVLSHKFREKQHFSPLSWTSSFWQTW